jgi:hypothetical protein
MSHYNDFKTTLTDPKALERALRAYNLHGKKIIFESHDKACTMQGYGGQTQSANIIIRKEQFNGLGDMGFVLKDGAYALVTDDYDRRDHFTNPWMGELTMHYNVEKTKMELEAKNIPYEQLTDSKGRIQLRAKFKTSTVTTGRISVKR